MQVLLTIIWDIYPEILGFMKDNAIPVRWYGFLFAAAFLIGYQLMERMLKKDGAPEEWLDKVFIYVMIGTIVGARLGHVLFYGPYHTPNGTGYFDDPISILKIWEGGLASHGAAIAIIVSLWFYSKKVTKKSVLWILDRVVITVAIAGCFIRTGNLMNSEMIGKVSDDGLNVVFSRDAEDYIATRLGDAFEAIDFSTQGEKIIENDTAFQPLVGVIEVNNRIDPERLAAFVNQKLPDELNAFDASEKHILLRSGFTDAQIKQTGRCAEISFNAYGVIRHPAQFYEAIAYLLIFLLLYWWYWYKGMGEYVGFTFGMFLILIFGARFCIEFLKENQVAFEENLTLNMGQNLSIPLVLAGLFFVIRALRKSK